MNKSDGILAKKSHWLYVAPVANLVLTDRVNFEHQVIRCTFVTSSRIARRRGRLGFPETRGDYPSPFEAVLGEADTVGLVRHSGLGSEAEKRAESLLRNEVAILTASQRGFARRLNASSPTLSGASPRLGRGLLIDTKGKSWVQSNKVESKVGALVLDGRWRKWSKEFFYFRLLKILRGETKVSNGWRRDLYNAAVLAGQSYATRYVPQAFLWNMVAIECLLARQQDKWAMEVPKRTEAFIGWAVHWETFAARLDEVYLTRNAVVHAGDLDSVSVDDVLFTDDLLFDLLTNICHHIKLFPNKDAVVEFGERRAAEIRLGIDAKVRPKLQTVTKRYTEADREAI